MFAIVPPPGVEQQIQKERLLFSENYNCHKALKPPVHITMYEPFKQEELFEEDIVLLKKWSQNQKPFNIVIQNFSFFENPRSPVVYISVVKDENITLLRTSLLKELKHFIEADAPELINGRPVPPPRPQPFHPHFTIGYRDVPPALFPAIKKAYINKRFSASFICDKVVLWKHNGINWQTITEFPFGKEDPLAQQSLF